VAEISKVDLEQIDDRREFRPTEITTTIQERTRISLSECIRSMYRHRKQRPNTAKLPKVLRDELVSLGNR
jgi:hypothetical protein